jgi:hypothetical protein
MQFLKWSKKSFFLKNQIYKPRNITTRSQNYLLRNEPHKVTFPSFMQSRLKRIITFNLVSFSFLVFFFQSEVLYLKIHEN